jgi:hypothetical protein
MSARTSEAEPLLTPAKVATMFRVNPKTVTRWAKAGKLTSFCCGSSTGQVGVEHGGDGVLRHQHPAEERSGHRPRQRVAGHS